MSLWNLFSGPTPEKLARQADALLKAQQWGPAKVALERALEKTTDQALAGQLTAELRVCCDHLAQAHLEQATDLLQGGHALEAADFFRLAMEVARDPQLIAKAEEGLARLARAGDTQTIEPVYYSPTPASISPGSQVSREENDEATFWALIGTLPEDMQDAYEDYGEPFRSGYLALNQGDFERAADLLVQAHHAHPQAGSYIPLELAAACAHTGRSDEARELLVEFLHYHPDILPAYQLFCDLLWEAGDFAAVDELLAGVPADLMDTVALVLLRGENHLRAERFDSGSAYLEQVLSDFGWSDSVAQLLADIYAEAGQSAKARSVYADLMQRCQSCHSRVDPQVKHNYAELSFADGQRDTRLLELYLSLAQEVPEQAAHYFRRVSAVYDAQGYREEAERFRALAEGWGPR